MKTLLKLAIVAVVFAWASPAYAQLHVGLHVNIGPPAPREEVVAVRPHGDVVWIAGFYRWHSARHRYIWVPGRWGRPPRPHSVWVPGRWERRRGEWVYFEGRWEGERVRKR